MKSDFLSKVEEIIEDNISNEQFGVSDLASRVGMSRSNLLRRIKKLTGVSASRYISVVRLEKAKELLSKEDYTVSEVGFKVGFNSTSYFIKCFREHYGYPPGELGRRQEEVPGRKKKWIRTAAGIALLAIIAYIVFGTGIFSNVGQLFSYHEPSADKKSIAVLPFINDSDDSTNIYFINGLMESTLNSLQKIKGIRVISRTSVEKYRENPKPVSDIADELDVDYIVEGSGQKSEDQIFLHIQLIEAKTDRHLISEQYIRDWTDIFQLQLDIAGQIADKIEIVLSPEEEEQINKKYTDDPEAYDLFMKALYKLNKGTAEGLFEGISWLHKAVLKDPGYARAYAALGISYYYLDYFSPEKDHVDSVNYYADLALLHDPTLAQGMLAKAMFYLHTGERELALPYLEKAQEYNPNSPLILNILSDYYTSIEPNTEKYLEYAIKGLSLDPAPEDSMQTSIAYLHIANALVQSGFVDEARKYIDRSLMFDPDNIFSMYVKEYTQFAKDKDIERLCNGLVEVLKKDTTRLDVLQETAKVHFYARDYEASFFYYSILANARRAYNLDIYSYENAKMAYVFREKGMEHEADSLFAIAKAFFDQDQSIYRNLSLAAYYAYYDRVEDALEHIKLFLEEENYYYWVVLFLDIEPLFDNLKDHPEYQQHVKEIKSKFWNYHERMRTNLIEKGVI
jgi:TolB-like protein/AraC-like DNA-binding protein/uncharacterized protein HemY